MKASLKPGPVITRLEVGIVQSPLGPLTIATRDQRLCAIYFEERGHSPRRQLERRFGRFVDDPGHSLAQITAKLDAYFGGDLNALEGIDVDTGGTPFQQKVWIALRQIPAGATMSYSYLAHLIGTPHAVRAVGAANGANPIPLVIPCHRVIGAAGRLIGYGGGLHRKRWLLAHEGALASQLFE